MLVVQSRGMVLMRGKGVCIIEWMMMRRVVIVCREARVYWVARVSREANVGRMTISCKVGSFEWNGGVVYPVFTGICRVVFIISNADRVVSGISVGGGRGVMGVGGGIGVVSGGYM